MFGLIPARCPLDVREQTWVELRMQWLVDRLGLAEIQKVKVLTPSPEDFPEAFSGSEREVEQIFGRICNQMDVPRNSVELAVFDGVRRSPYIQDRRGSALGLYEQRTADAERHTVWIERSQTTDLLHLIATTAHELAHCILLGGKLLTVQEADHEFVTDLLPVARGLGVFAANAALIEESHPLLYGSWRSVSKKGYLPSRMFGYALAVFAALRGESRPRWGRYLRGDPHGAFVSGLKYLRKTNASLCAMPMRADRDIPKGLSERLKSHVSGCRLAALWELRRPGPQPLTEDEWTALGECLDCRDPIVISEAALAIAALGHSDEAVIRKCLYALPRHHANSEVESAIARALGAQKEALDKQPALFEPVIDALQKLLEREPQRVVISALTALSQLKPNLDSLAFRQIMQVFRLGLIKCDELLVMHAVSALRAICDAPHKKAAEFFGDDAELRSHAHAALSADIDGAELATVVLPTAASQPVPLPEWRPTPIILPVEPEGAQDDTAADDGRTA
jgi:hypothetical protein